MKIDPSVLNKVASSAGSVLSTAGEKLKNIDVAPAIEKMTKSVSELDAGVLLTKAQDAAAKLDLEGKKKELEDFLDSPKMDSIKSAARTAKDFAGFIPYYAQSVPEMIKGALSKEKKE